MSAAIKNITAQAEKNEAAKKLCENQYQLDKVAIQQYASVIGACSTGEVRLRNYIKHLKEHSYTDNGAGCWLCHTMVETNT